MAASHVCTPLVGAPFKKPSSLLYYQDGPPASVDIDAWRLEITGLVERPCALSYADLLRLEQVVDHRRTVCVCNWSVRHHYGGVRLAAVLELAGVPDPGGLYLKQESLGTPERGRYGSTVPLAPALARGAMLCHSIDGQPLSLERGFPVRFIEFGLYLYKSVKGLARLEITTAWELGEWERRAGYPLDGTIRPKKYWICDLNERRHAAHHGEIKAF